MNSNQEVCIQQALAAALAAMISTIIVLLMSLLGKLHSGEWTQWMIAFAVSFVLIYAPCYMYFMLQACQRQKGKKKILFH